jgi:hypothetical protein
LSYIYRVENENEKEIIKWLNELSSKEIEDLKQSRIWNAWKDSSLCSHWNLKVDAQAALAAQN